MNPRRIPDKAVSQRHPTVFGAGLIALDLVISATPESPIRAWAGGTCGNVLTILSYLGWQAYPIARLNDTPAAQRLQADLRRWGVHLEHVKCEPTVDAPIIVQEIRRNKSGEPIHRFRSVWPHCGHWLPSYRPVTAKAAANIEDRLARATVFFLDRLSAATLKLASAAAKAGAIVFLEPSSRNEPRLLDTAFAIAHVVKYSEQRIDIGTKGRPGRSVLLEIKTMGQRGLAYRSWLPKAPGRAWQHLPSIPAPVLADACGAGDWCAAGIVSKIGACGIRGLATVTPSTLRASLRYGQALAAWNCGFEGARGGMYAVTRATFDKQIGQILNGRSTAPVDDITDDDAVPESITCRACSPSS